MEDTHKTPFEVLSQSKDKLFYFIFDAVQNPEARTFWEAMVSGNDVAWEYLYQGTEYAHLMDASPLIIEIKEGKPGETLLYWIHDYTQRFPNTGIVGVYNGSMASLHSHWQQWVSIIDKSGTSRMLRFYDTSVLLELFDVLTDGQRGAFIGAHEALYMPDVIDDKPMLLPCWDEETGSPWAPQDALSSPIVLTSEQHDIFFWPERVEELITAVHSDLAPNYAWLLKRQNVRNCFIEGLHIASEKYPNATRNEWETFAYTRFYLGDKFYQHPEFERLLAIFSIKKAITVFYNKHKGDELLKTKYTTRGWLGIEGRATLITE